MLLDSRVGQEELAWTQNDANINQKSFFDYVLGYSLLGGLAAHTSYFITSAVVERSASTVQYAGVALFGNVFGIIWAYRQFLKDTVREPNQGESQP